MFLEFNFLDQFPFETPRSQKPLSITCLKSVTPKLEKRKISGSLGVGGGGRVYGKTGVSCDFLDNSSK